MPAVLESVARTLRRVTGDPHKRLNVQMAEVQNLCASLGEITKEIDARTDISRYRQAVNDRYARWQSDVNNIDLEISYKVGVMVFNSERERIEPILRRQVAFPVIDEALGQLFKKRRDWRDVLKKACEAKLAVAKQDHGELVRKVARQLGDGYDPQDDQRVKSSQHQMSRWQACIEQCETNRDDLKVWKDVTRNLFE